MSSRNRLLSEALQLPRAERADFAKHLLESLDDDTEQDVEAAWLDEVDRRLKDFDRGDVVAEPWESVRERLREQLRAARR